MRSFTIWLLLALPLTAQTQELGLTLGNVLGNTRGAVKLSAGQAFQANYGYRLAKLGSAAALLGEVHFLANPQRTVTSLPTATRDVASLFLTPSIRIKFLPDARLSPWATIGGGLGVYEHSTTLIDSRPNPAPRTVTRGAFTFGGGVDFKVKSWLALRGEVRDFYSGIPVYNVPSVSGRQHNIVVSGGFVIRFP